MVPRARSVATVVLALLSACSEEEPERVPIDVPPAQPADSEPEPEPEPEGYRVADTPAGTVEGVVRWEGPRPRNPELEVHRQHRTCGRSQEVPAVIVGRGGGVASAVVSIDDVDSGPRAIPDEAPVLDQIGCRYEPHTLAVMRGTPITFRNSDDVLHNVHAIWEDGATWFNVGQPRAGMSNTEIPERTGVARLVCDAGHTWMLAWLHVFDHPYFTVTGEDGTFRLENVPAGEQTVRLWHQGWEVLGTESGRPRWSDPVELTETVQVPDGGTITVEFTLPPAAPAP